jgi:GNAT superfamily N-acetyltransferase
MPQIEIHPAQKQQIAHLAKINYIYQTNYVWQMERNVEDGQPTIAFKKVRLPRAIRVAYPLPKSIVDDSVPGKILKLVALLSGMPIGFIIINILELQQTAWVSALAVIEEHRCQGIGSGLLLAAQDWALQQKKNRMVVEMQSKNIPAIQFVQKLGFEFSGYNDHHYANQDIAVFFSKYLR